MIDRSGVACVYVIKLMRFLVVWVALFIIEKIYQDAYVSSVLIRSGKPPDLRPMIVYALLADFVFFTFILVVINMLMAQKQQLVYGHIIDMNLVSILVFDYIGSVLVLGIVGCGVASVVQNKHILRYRDDGLRSIRALGTLLLYCAIIVLSIPFFMVLT